MCVRACMWRRGVLTETRFNNCGHIVVCTAVNNNYLLFTLLPPSLPFLCYQLPPSLPPSLHPSLLLTPFLSPFITHSLSPSLSIPFSFFSIPPPLPPPQQLFKLSSTITSLTSRMDRLETELENIKSVRLRHSSSTRQLQADRGDITPRYSRRDRQMSTGVDHRRWSGESASSVASSIFENHHRTPFIWQMPFTVKCIGTFR